MAINSKRKGARAERELAGKLREYGYPCRRSVQYSGANGDADVVGLPGIHIECKRVERLDLPKALEQADRDARPGELPVVMHRKDYSPWLVTSFWRWNDQVGARRSWRLEYIDMGQRGRVPDFYSLLKPWKCLEYQLRFSSFPIYTMLLEDWMEIYTSWEVER